MRVGITISTVACRGSLDSSADAIVLHVIQWLYDSGPTIF